MKEELIIELVAEDFRRGQILQDFGIDIFSGAKQTLQDYCLKEGLSLVRIVSNLEDLSTVTSSNRLPFDSWPLDFLCFYIVEKHHKYVYRCMTLLLALMDNLAKEGESPAMNKIYEVFKRMARDMALHMKKEESILFPFIEQMVEAEKENVKIERPFFGTVNNPTEIMEIEHEYSWEDISLIRTLTGNYNISESSEPLIVEIFNGLEEFERDLLVHLDLENNILFPKAILLEKQLGLS